MLFIGLSRYTKKDVVQIISLKPDGVILGDILCNKKMFPFAGEEMEEYINMFVNNGMDVIIQTPMYATDRVFEKIKNSLNYYYANNLIRGVIVQDVGVARSIRTLCPYIEIIWGRMGYARTPVMNLATLSFYLKYGISAFECKNVNQFEIAKKNDATPYLVYGWPLYSTINRECYYKFENNIFDDACYCGCLSKDKIVLGTNRENETAIDGYVLGLKNSYHRENADFYSDEIKMIVYGESFDEICLRLGELEEANR